MINRLLDPEYFQVVCLPDYVIQTLANKNVTLNVLDSIVGDALNTKSPAEMSQQVNETDSDTIAIGAKLRTEIQLKRIEKAETDISNKLFSSISKYDYKDIVLSNQFVANYFNVSTPTLDSKIVYEDNRVTRQLLVNITDADLAEFINMYKDEALDLEAIIMSNSLPGTQRPFEFIPMENIFIVVLKKGITNFIVYNVKKFPEFFVSSLLNKMFKIYGSEYTFASNVFKVFNKFQKFI